METTKAEADHKDYLEAYSACLSLWPVAYKTVYVTTSYGDTHILISGSEENPPLLLLHGLGFSSTMWYPNIAELSKSCCTYCIDIVGDANKTIFTRKPASRSELSEWLLEVIKALNLERPDLAGLSYGGFIALNFAIHYPEYINKVILLSPAGTLQPFKLQFFARVFSTLFFSGKKALLDNFLRWMFEERYEMHPLFLQQLTAGMRLRRSSSVDRGKKKSKSIWPSVIPNDELKNIKSDVMLLLGEEEVIYNPVKGLKRAKKWIPRIDAKLLKNVGHGMSMEQPDLINNYILSFLQK
ncbi:alpha/beta fold hydrolase [Paenibacillus durus]|uniref:AB hydrolase-1 domain-containing protein n=1 Tax=Paenibacillus durus TaxID=44251 RepID=A0A089HRS7_PAEDU|nr:alpha/beta hydrolase [Paenibacillus durus]AIQ13400.1 hypothetical protein PDUR_16855 [Paenibacillus durus]